MQIYVSNKFFKYKNIKNKENANDNSLINR